MIFFFRFSWLLDQNKEQHWFWDLRCPDLSDSGVYDFHILHSTGNLQSRLSLKNVSKWLQVSFWTSALEYRYICSSNYFHGISSVLDSLDYFLEDHSSSLSNYFTLHKCYGDCSLYRMIRIYSSEYWIKMHHWQSLMD